MEEVSSLLDMFPGLGFRVGHRFQVEAPRPAAHPLSSCAHRFRGRTRPDKQWAAPAPRPQPPRLQPPPPRPLAALAPCSSRPRTHGPRTDRRHHRYRCCPEDKGLGAEVERALLAMARRCCCGETDARFCGLEHARGGVAVATREAGRAAARRLATVRAATKAAAVRMGAGTVAEVGASLAVVAGAVEEALAALPLGRLVETKAVVATAEETRDVLAVGGRGWTRAVLLLQGRRLLRGGRRRAAPWRRRRSQTRAVATQPKHTSRGTRRGRC